MKGVLAAIWRAFFGVPVLAYINYAPRRILRNHAN